ncbi:hypothetical protein B0H14DRAFT_2624646 [Mycena olivaceomarginata]|nr:hypothetical protein B0H14DRAFT_2624646 [Mycena olivaceomarginata]
MTDSNRGNVLRNYYSQYKARTFILTVLTRNLSNRKQEILREKARIRMQKKRQTRTEGARQIANASRRKYDAEYREACQAVSSTRKYLKKNGVDKCFKYYTPLLNEFNGDLAGVRVPTGEEDGDDEDSPSSTWDRIFEGTPLMTNIKADTTGWSICRAILGVCEQHDVRLRTMTPVDESRRVDDSATRADESTTPTHAHTSSTTRVQANDMMRPGASSMTRVQANYHKITMNWVQYWKKIVLKRHVIIRRWPLEGHPRNPASIHDVESMRKLCDAWESGDCYWQKLNGDEQEEVKEMVEEMVESGEVEGDYKGSSRKSQPSKALSTRSKTKDAPGRRVWEEDETTDEEGMRQKEKERRKTEKEKERRKAETEKEKVKVKPRKSEKGSQKRKADDTTDPRPAKHQSTSRKGDPPSAKHKSTAGDGGRSQKKRKRQDDSDADEPTPKSRSKQAPDAPKSRFEVMHNRLRALATGKSGSITTKLPPAMRKGPPGIRPGTVEFTALGLKGMDEDSDDDSDSDN